MNVGVMAVLSTARDVQAPLLGALLLFGGAAKVRRMISTGSIASEMGPTLLFPVRMRRPAALVVCACELALGAGLLVTVGEFGAGAPALVFRLLTVVLFGTAVGALHELRTRQPQAGCGCFGDLSDTPVGWRTLSRSALLSVAALVSVGARPLHKPPSAGQATVALAVLGAELCMLAALSPEVGEVMVRLGYSEPCEIRRLPVEHSLAKLRASPQWREHREHLLSKAPVDVWREGCWRFAVYPGMLSSRRVEVVFAVYLKARHPPVRVGIFDPLAGNLALPAVPAQRRGDMPPAAATTLPLSKQV